MSNYILNETKVFDDQNPSWMNAETENLITAKNEVYKKYLKTIEIAIIISNIKRSKGN